MDIFIDDFYNHVDDALAATKRGEQVRLFHQEKLIAYFIAADNAPNVDTNEPFAVE